MSAVYRKGPASRAADIVIYLLVAILFGIALYPFYYVFIISVMPYDRYISQSVHLLPSGFTLDYFSRILSDIKIVRAYGVSIFVTVVGTALNMVLTGMIAYTISKPRLKLFKPLNLFVIIPMIFNGGLIPFYLVTKELHLINTVWAMILPFAVSSFNVLLMKNFFMTLPEEIEESAKMDGAGDFLIFRRIIVPVSMPVVATITLFYGTFHWNEFFWSGIFVSDQGLYPITVMLQNMLAASKIATQVSGASTVAVSFTSAIILLIVIPVLFVYPFFQRFFASGLILGAVKG